MSQQTFASQAKGILYCTLIHKSLLIRIKAYFYHKRNTTLKKRLQWKALLANKKYLSFWLLSLLCTLVALVAAGLYLCYNETRNNGVVLNDFILANITARDVSTALFSITWICILGGLPVILRTPDRAMRVFWSICIMSLFRCIVMYMVPLEPPIGIIPLRDPFVEGAFYDNKVLVKDLFFSGHTSNMVILTLLMDIKWFKVVLGIASALVGYLLLVQHVHYAIDVIAAPFFAYFAYRIALMISNNIIQSTKIIPSTS